MDPTVPAGALVAVATRGRAPGPGDVVVARLSDGRELVKRVMAIGPDGYRLAGDNPLASTDSRTFGAVPATAITGRAFLAYWPPRAWRVL